MCGLTPVTGCSFRTEVRNPQPIHSHVPSWRLAVSSESIDWEKEDSTVRRPCRHHLFIHKAQRKSPPMSHNAAILPQAQGPGKGRAVFMSPVRREPEQRERKPLLFQPRLQNLLTIPIPRTPDVHLITADLCRRSRAGTGKSRCKRHEVERSFMCPQTVKGDSPCLLSPWLITGK